MNPYVHLKLHQLQEEQLNRRTTACLPVTFHHARKGVRHLLDLLSSPACSSPR